MFMCFFGTWSLQRAWALARASSVICKCPFKNFRSIADAHGRSSTDECRLQVTEPHHVLTWADVWAAGPNKVWRNNLLSVRCGRESSSQRLFPHFFKLDQGDCSNWRTDVALGCLHSLDKSLSRSLSATNSLQIALAHDWAASAVQAANWTR